MFSIENVEGSIEFHRGCGWNDSRTEWCSINNIGTNGEFKSCYKTCSTPLCNHASMDEAFPSFSLNCLHSSCLDDQPRCLVETKNVMKKCWSGRCLSSRNGRINRKKQGIAYS